jgi:multidrug efflux system outer membrane protein
MVGCVPREKSFRVLLTPFFASVVSRMHFGFLSLVRRTFSFGLMVGFLALTGCVSPPPPETGAIAIDVPDQWRTGSMSGAFEPQSWMADIADPQLVVVLEEAMRHNFGILAAEARLDAAIAGTVSSGSSIWPTLSGNLSKNTSRRNAASGIQQTPIAKTYGLTGRFNWEIDLWGKLRNGYRADLADAQSAVADFEATRLLIAGRTAKAWYNLVEAEQQLTLAKQILEAFETSVRIVEEGFASGISSALDVRLVRANLASAGSTYELRLRSRDAEVRTMEIILGRYPSGEFKAADAWPTIRADVPAGLPTELLLRRPDVLAAERDLAAAQQRKFVAKKAMLPSLDLTLTRGTSDTATDNLLDLDTRRVWSRVWNLSQPLFQGRRLKANAERAEANHRLAVANFTSVAITAFKEVEDALGEQGSFLRDYELQQVGTEESVAAEVLAWERYESGLANITTALDAVRRSIAAQRSLIQITNQRIQSRIDLYLALGGGFTSNPPDSN